MTILPLPNMYIYKTLFMKCPYALAIFKLPICGQGDSVGGDITTTENETDYLDPFQSDFKQGFGTEASQR